jgi:arylsulfatase A-like enzyme
MQGRSVHQDRWHYIAWDGGAEALFDLKGDPHQMQNLSAMPEHAATLAAMRKLLKNSAAANVSPKREPS